jgi:hypothetical protein
VSETAKPTSFGTVRINGRLLAYFTRERVYDTLVRRRKIIASTPLKSISPVRGSGTPEFALAPTPLEPDLPSSS